MTTLMVVDPGQMSGYFYGEFSESKPLTRLGYKQVPGGSLGFHAFMEGRRADVVVSEKFAPRPIGNRLYKLEELEPLRIEGWLEIEHPNIIWQPPSAMVLKNGSSQAERKRNSDDVLRRNGWWLTGKNVDYKDANDANAAAKHALAYMRSIRHAPTIDAYLA